MVFTLKPVPVKACLVCVNEALVIHLAKVADILHNLTGEHLLAHSGADRTNTCTHGVIHHLVLINVLLASSELCTNVTSTLSNALTTCVEVAPNHCVSGCLSGLLSRISLLLLHP